jgi:hypothetical protein
LALAFLALAFLPLTGVLALAEPGVLAGTGAATCSSGFAGTHTLMRCCQPTLSQQLSTE